MTDKQEAAPLSDATVILISARPDIASMRDVAEIANELVQLRSQLTEAVKERDEARADAIKAEEWTEELHKEKNEEVEWKMEARAERDALASKFDAVVKEVEALQAQLAEREKKIKLLEFAGKACEWKMTGYGYRTECGIAQVTTREHCPQCGGRVQIKTDKEG